MNIIMMRANGIKKAATRLCAGLLDRAGSRIARGQSPGIDGHRRHELLDQHQVLFDTDLLQSLLSYFPGDYGTGQSRKSANAGRLDS